MPPRTLVGPAIAALLVASPIAAQTTWIVDAARGPGYTFADLPGAEAAAKDGDLILVRRGVYSPITTSKGLTIVGEIAGIRMPPNTTFTVRNLRAGSRFVLGGSFLFIDGNGVPIGPTMLLENNKGQVNLSNVQINPGRNRATSCHIKACVAVSLDRCLFLPTAIVENSHVTASSGMFRANSHLVGLTGPGLKGSKSTIELTDMDVYGSSGDSTVAPHPAVSVRQCDVIVRGDQGSTYTGGMGFSVPSAAAFDGTNNSSSLVIDPTVTVTGAITSFKSLTRTRLAALSVTDPVLGGTAKLRLYSDNGDLFGILASLPGSPLLIPTFGWSWLDPATAVLIAAGQQTSPYFNGKLPLPANPALRGLPLTVQAIAGNATRGFRLSNGVIQVLR